MSFVDVLFSSANGYNVLIIIAAVVAAVLLIFSIIFAKGIQKDFDSTNGDGLKRRHYYLTDITYTLFVTIISLFPLLGMLGTVASLIELGGVFQSDNADMNSIKSEFFLALTSTAWGIIASVLFKLLNAGFQPFIENHISKAKSSLNI